MMQTVILFALSFVKLSFLSVHVGTIFIEGKGSSSTATFLFPPRALPHQVRAKQPHHSRRELIPRKNSIWTTTASITTINTFPPYSKGAISTAKTTKIYALSSSRDGVGDEETPITGERISEETIEHVSPLSSSVESTRREWIKHRLEMSEDETVRLLAKFPDVINYPITETVAPVFDWMQSTIFGGGNSSNDVRALKKFVLVFPQIVSFSPTGNLEPKIQWLQDRLSLNNAETAAMIRKEPSILGCDLIENVESTIQWIMESLHLNEKEAKRIIRLLPGIIELDTVSNLEPKIRWLRDRLSLSDRKTARMVQRFPILLKYNATTNMEPKIAYLRDRFSLNEKGVSNMIQKLPAILGYGIQTNLEPTILFYEECIGTSSARKLLSENPSMLCASLERRLKPRVEETRALGLDIDNGLMQRISQSTANKWSQSLTHYEGKSRKTKKKEEVSPNKPLSSPPYSFFEENVKQSRTA